MCIAALLLNTTDSLPWDTKEDIKCGQALEQTHIKKCIKLLNTATAPAEKRRACNTADFQEVASTNAKSIESP